MELEGGLMIREPTALTAGLESNGIKPIGREASGYGSPRESFSFTQGGTGKVAANVKIDQMSQLRQPFLSGKPVVDAFE
jgi:hypothetical protein